MAESFARLLVFIVLAVFIGAAHSQSQPQSTVQSESPPVPPQSPPILNGDADKGFRIEFLGKEPSSDWARVAEKLGRSL